MFDFFDTLPPSRANIIYRRHRFPSMAQARKRALSFCRYRLRLVDAKFYHRLFATSPPSRTALAAGTPAPTIASPMLICAGLCSRSC